MKETTLFKLKKQALRSGGDRYTNGEMDIYVPQRLSRDDRDKCKPALWIIITDEPLEQAKST